MLNALNAYQVKGARGDRRIMVAAANMEGALDMAQEQIDGQWSITKIKRIDVIYVEQPDVGK